jgi:hypothetical protein
VAEIESRERPKRCLPAIIPGALAAIAVDPIPTYHPARIDAKNASKSGFFAVRSEAIRPLWMISIVTARAPRYSR